MSINSNYALTSINNPVLIKQGSLYGMNNAKAEISSNQFINNKAVLNTSAIQV